MKKLICLLCFLCSVPVVGSAQSLADAARKERERQKEVQKDVKSTVTTFSAQGAATTTSATTSSTTQEVKPFELKDNNGHDEKYWRKQFDDARADLKHAEDKAQVLNEKIKGLNTAILNRSDIYNRENVLGAEVTKNQKELEDAQKDVEKARQKISDLEDDLRKAGGPAGWAR